VSPLNFFGRALDVDVAGTSCLALVLDVAGTPRLALVLDVAGTPRLALVLDVAGSPAFPPRCLLLHTIATFALMIAVLAPRSLALAVAALPCQRARQRDRLGILGC
jgi:hypothetical protein